MACGLALKRPLELDSLHSPEGVKRARLSPLRTSFSAASPPSSSAPPSAFGGAARSTLSRQQLESYLRAEIKSLRRRRILPATPSLKRKADDFRSAPRSPHHSSDDDDAPAPSAAHEHREPQPGFSFTQVHKICERLMKEQEERLRAEYDAVLHNKLTEQYETFVKFTQDQIQRRSAMDEAPSYLS